MLYIFISLLEVLHRGLEWARAVAVAVAVAEREEVAWSSTHSHAYKIHTLFSSNPDNMKQFLEGKQFLTFLSIFILTQLTVFPSWPPPTAGSSSSSLISNPSLHFLLFQSGATGLFITTSLYHLMPSLIASTRNPLSVLSLIGGYWSARAVLGVGQSGICHTAGIIYYITRYEVS